MTFEERVAALPADQRARLAERLRRLGALPDAADPAGRRLVAYVICRPGHGADPAGLRDFLGAQLPDYMVPSAFVALSQLPVTESGKIDRRALPAPEAVHGFAAPALAAPSTPEEVTLAGLWAEILRLDAVGVDQNFFELGGDSILLLKLCARARESGLALTPRAVYEHPTISELAAWKG